MKNTRVEMVALVSMVSRLLFYLDACAVRILSLCNFRYNMTVGSFHMSLISGDAMSLPLQSGVSVVELDEVLAALGLRPRTL